MHCLGLLVPLAGAALALGQEPVFQGYGRKEGLPHEQVRCLRQDERGYLWIGTAGRVCRHDGSAVREWPVEAAAPERTDQLAVGPGGRMFLGGTGPSLHAYDPAAQPCFTALELRGDDLGRNIAALAVDGRHRLFAATEAGLFAAEVAGRTCSLHAVRRDARNDWYGALATDARGRLLYARSGLAVRIDGDDEVAVELPAMRCNVWAIEPVEQDRYRVLGDWRLWEVDFAARSCRTLPLPSPPEKRCTAMCTDRRGSTWLGTVDGLWRFGAGMAAEVFLAGTWIQSLYVDRAGDLWVGTQQNGLLQASARPFTQVRGAGQGGAVRPVKLLRLADAAVVASHTDGLYRVAARTLQPTGCAAAAELRTGSDVEVDAFGNLWFGTGEALLQVAADRVDEGSVTWQRWAIAAQRLCRDACGRVLGTAGTTVVTMVPGSDGAMRMEQRSLPPDLAGGYAVGGDGGGTVYYRTRSGELWRLSADGEEPCTDRGARLVVHSVYQERGGRLWILPANRTGLAIVEPGRGASLDPRWIDAADGLPGNRVVASTTDERGGAWLALAAALCHFDPSTGRVRSWPWPADAGLAGVNDMAIDPAGRVLIATDDHLIAFAPAAQLATDAPAVLLTSVLVAGTPLRLPDGGTANVDPLTAPAGRGDLLVNFCAPGSRVGAAPVQYRLLPSSPEFGAPLLAPTLQLASLAPGDYRLELRAAALDGLPPGPPTIVALRVPKPFWARAEFFAGVAALAVLAGVLLHRLRVRRLLALEAVRRQVATDLHDDLGSGLAQVAVLSEVAKRKAPPLAGALDEIGGLARSMRESLSDIVWAVDPTKDTLAAVVNRLRQVAANLFGDGTVSVHFAAPPGAAMDAIALRPDRRRHLFLFCKEALTNAARHAQARTVAIDVARTAAGLRVEVADDGRGFDPAAAGEAGNGLASLRARAVALGADFSLQSAPGRGTAIALEVRLS